MSINLTQQNKLNSFTCIFSTDGYKMPFTLDNTITKNQFIKVNQYPVNLPLLGKFFTEEQLQRLDGSSKYNNPPTLDLPIINLKYSDHDAPI